MREIGQTLFKKTNIFIDFIFVYCGEPLHTYHKGKI